MRTRLLSLAVLLALSAVAFGAEPGNVWWAFRPLSRPTVPDVSATKTAPANPVDQFIRTKLKDKGLSLAPEADRRTLIRRVTFGLTGLPPTPEEVEAFVNDRDASAYEKLVDRLLASPAYGERFARLWMDAVHFAETHGHDQDRVRPNAWRYRDYLIQALNADTPYARFVKEQVAADVLFPNESKLIPALGFLAAGPWDESSLRDIREDSIDREAGRYLDRDDIVTTVFNTFSGLTVQCARCHDHKFDPITQEEYYRLQAVFAGVGRGDVAFEPNPATAKKRTELRDRLAAIAKNAPELDLTSAHVKKTVAEWELKHAGAGVVWTVPAFTAITSDAGSKLVMRGDDSIRAEGTRPERDTYTLTTRVKARRVTAVRLELLTDETLPMHGPGRCDNGNLHLSEFKVTASDGGKPRALKVRNATADFDQSGWTAAHAIDGNPGTAWGIYPQVGKPHEAVFELAEPVAAGGETELTFALEQLHGGGHLIGRFRLSITDAPPPVKATALPATLQTILATAPAKRTDVQARELALHVLKEQTGAELAALPAPAVVYAAAPNFTADGSHRPTPAPRAVRMLKRGDIRKPGEEVEPAALSLLAKLPGEFDLRPNHTEGARRAALAMWLTDTNNPLTWRVMANRVWQWHFGAGLAGTPNDFGRMGQKPTHPELLDFLASELANPDSKVGGGSLKHLHRLIVTSATYKQVSLSRAEGLKADEDNKLLWRQNRTRLDAEQVRDAVLAVSDRLDRTAGGPSDQQFDMKPGIHVTPVVDYNKFAWEKKEGHRRSVYRFVFRTLPDPLVECLDGADASALTPKRSESVTAPQALALLNNEFVLVHARAMAGRLAMHSADRAKQVEFACRLVWGRPPSAEEGKLFTAYADKHGLANFCRVLFNTNEFLFAD
ncbi:hypothetical protein VT84_16575 [Gemmata sp. SH-PL17]|uniref:DUF1549 and DUF1553 domain-containing protein n=1 Tax=Gemmata sp. SH-PL17 TaxID=1630693 RepID=UPI00078E3281|nr:DUF1549 and DUF1553 domain-containing protein [Gemmata sp. SH-PL17]AMV26016.1 hypothetical protein VT84_16575 [Gemmata sp. SH-PL17]